jgi:hypothetical protein
MAHISWQNNQKNEAMGMWTNAYIIARQIGYAQVLQALANLAPQLGLPEGLEGWEELAKRTVDGGRGTEDGGEEQVEAFVTGVVRAHREKRPEAGKYFEAVSKMAADPAAPPRWQELWPLPTDR